MRKTKTSTSPDLNCGHNTMMTPSRGISDANLCFGALFLASFLYICMNLSARWRIMTGLRFAIFHHFDLLVVKR